MANPQSAWGIDIGQAGLKAIKLRREGEDIRAVAFDYIPHPKILSQPDAIPDELIAQSVETFVTRNKIRNDHIAVSVSGQSSLAKFIKLPPVEPSKVAEIVQYEAKQQIPFPLDEVIWDYQTIGGGVEESGFMLEAEVGLFAMKRELVYQAMAPLTEHRAEIELVQMAPLALYSYLSYDVLGFRAEGGAEPPESDDYYIVLDMGADNTTLLVSNGSSIWVRNVPIGGNHFTRALTREMKLTFAKAEHLKCNATRAPDPKAVFQAMRPVFNDYVTEIQRSIGFFGSANRNAKIKKVYGAGNGFRMAGLQKFLQQHLQYEVQKLDELQGVTGDGVLSDPLFIDNMMTFAVPYGLALQTLGATRIKTTLLPPEITVQRTIRRKKPWAVGMAAGLMLATGISVFASAGSLGEVSPERWADAYGAQSNLNNKISSNRSAYDAEKAAFDENIKNEEALTAPLQKRELWIELVKNVFECLPQDVGNAAEETDVTKQKRLRITSITQKQVGDVEEWYKAVTEEDKLAEEFPDKYKAKGPKEFRDKYVQQKATEDADADGGGAGAAADSGEGNVGFIVTVRGHHYYFDKDVEYGKKGRYFINDTLIKNLTDWELDRDGGTRVPIGRMGITHPIIVHSERFDREFNPTTGQVLGEGGAMGGAYGGQAGGMEQMMAGGGRGMGGPGGPGGLGGPGMGGGRGPGGMGGPGMGTRGYDGGQSTQGTGSRTDVIDDVTDEETKKNVPIRQMDFVVQFVWVPTPVDKRPESEPKIEAEASDSGTSN